ncbi:MAG TPA: sigma-70 family RNA polymerase sigma factor, partial [Vicinamibacterales bacterium]
MTSNVESLYAEHRSFLWGLCYRMTGNAADADDVVQDTFVRAMQRPPRRTDDSLRPWLVTVALNLSRDLLRRRRRRDYVGPWLPSPIDTSGEEPGRR